MDSGLIGIFGGSFNPIHRGHLAVAKSVKEQIGLDELRLLPARVSPFKHKAEISDEARIRLIEAAINKESGIVLDSRELNRAPPSYSWDTLHDLHEEMPHLKLVFLLGVDAWLGFEGWHRWQGILNLSHLAIMSRPGFEVGEISPWWQDRTTTSVDTLRNKPYGHVIFLEVPQYPISSSQIRGLISQGKDASTFLAPQVAKLIKTEQLYQS